jgi:hypothetical protein
MTRGVAGTNERLDKETSALRQRAFGLPEEMPPDMTPAPVGYRMVQKKTRAFVDASCYQ